MSYAEPFTDEGKTCFVAHHNRNLSCFRYQPHRLTGVLAKSEGSFITAPLKIPREGLVLDADTSSGEIEVEILAADKSALEEAPRAHMTGKDTELFRLDFGEWTPSPPKGQHRLKITLRGSTLYSISPAQ